MLQLWQTGRLSAPPQTVALGAATIRTIAFAPDSQSLIAGSMDGASIVVEIHASGTLGTVAERLDTGFTSWTNTAAFSPDGHTAAIGNADGKLDVFDTATWKRRDMTTISAQVTAVQYSADSHVLLTAAADGTVRSWPSYRRTVTGLTGPSFSIAYDSSGSRLVIATSRKLSTVSLWAPTTSIVEDQQSTMLDALTVPPSFGKLGGTVAISGDGHLVATGNVAGQVVLDTVNADRFGGSPRQLTGAISTIESIAISPDAATVAAGSDDGYVHLWDVRDPANPLRLPALSSNGQVNSIAFSPDGRYLAAASIDRRIHLWDVTDPYHVQALPALAGFTNYAWSVAFSPDSRLLAAGGADDTIRIWAIDTPRQPQLVAGPMAGPTHYAFTLAFSPDGKALAAAGGDGTVWTWAVTRSGMAKVTAVLHTADPGGGTYAVAFSPDGTTLTAAGSAAELVQWRTDADAIAASICARAGDQLTRAEWAQYVPGAPYRDLCPSAD